MVRIQARTIFPANPQRTPESRFVAPTPMIAPVIVCVVLTGIPPNAVMSSVRPPAVSAQNPPAGLSFVIFCPMVLTMRQPPSNVPIAIAKWDIRITQFTVTSNGATKMKIMIFTQPLADAAL